MNLLVDLVKEAALVIRHIRTRFIIADGHAMVMCLEKLPPQANVINPGAVTAEITGKVQGQMMDRIESDHPVKQKL